MIKKQSKPLRGNRPGIQGTFRSGNRPATYPPVDPTKLTASARESLDMAAQLNLLLVQIRDHKPFAAKLMEAAQHSNQAEVDRLIKSTGVGKPYTIKYNPQGFHIVMQNDESEPPCCKVEVTLVWNE